jgi:hypothetical protein
MDKTSVLHYCNMQPPPQVNISHFYVKLGIVKLEIEQRLNGDLSLMENFFAPKNIQ